MLKELSDRCSVIEECYEFMLAYAGQGVPGDEGPSQIRDFLSRASQALGGLADAYGAAIHREKIDTAERYTAFLTVLERDAESSLAVIEMVLAQPRISSQLIDNLNASIHLRALLTDLFLIDEILKSHGRVETSSGSH